MHFIFKTKMCTAKNAKTICTLHHPTTIVLLCSLMAHGLDWEHIFFFNPTTQQTKTEQPLVRPQQSQQSNQPIY